MRVRKKERAIDLVAEVAVDLRTVDRFVTTRGPARPLGQARGVIGIPDENPAGSRLLLEMTFQTEGCAPFRQHSLVHRTMWRMAADASFAHGFMLEDEGTALRRVALETGFVVAQQRGAPTLERLGQVRAAAFDRVALVRVMAIGTTHFALEHGMMMR